MLGRRGPAQAAFTSAELRELGPPRRRRRCASTPRDVELDPVSRAVARRGGHVHRAQERRAAARVRGQAAARRRPAADRAALPALAGRDPRRRPGRGGRRPPQRDRARRRRRAAGAAASTRTVETIECGLVLRSVGYRAVPLPDVPFDERHFVLPNERGRVLAPDGEPLPGRLRRRLDQARPDRDPRHEQARRRGDGRAASSRTCGAGALPQPPNAGARADRRAARRAQAGPGHGRRLARDRRATSSSAGAAQQRPRVKLASRDELLAPRGKVPSALRAPPGDRRRRRRAGRARRRRARPAPRLRRALPDRARRLGRRGARRCSSELRRARRPGRAADRRPAHAGDGGHRVPRRGAQARARRQARAAHRLRRHRGGDRRRSTRSRSTTTCSSRGTRPRSSSTRSSRTC